MKTLKITLALAAVLMLTASGVKSEAVTVNEDPTYKNYSPNNLLAIEKKMLRLETRV